MSHRPIGRATVAALAASTLLTACTPLLSVDQRALVVAVAIDRGPCPGVRMTAQWYASSPSLSVAGGIRPETESACAATTAEAAQALRARTHRHLDLAVAGLVLVGRSLARHGLGGVLDSLWREGDLPETVQIATVDGTAATLLQGSAEGEQGFLLTTRLVDSFASNTGSVPIVLWRFVQRLGRWPGDAWTPLLAPSPGTVTDVGVAVYRGARLAGVLAGDQATAFAWLAKGEGAPDLRVPPAGGTRAMTLRITSHRVRRRCSGSMPALDLDLRARVREGAAVRVRERDIGPLETAAARAAYAQTAATLRALIGVASDPLDLGALACGGDQASAPTRAVALTVHVAIRPDERRA
jgi:hypothetical protein